MKRILSLVVLLILLVGFQNQSMAQEKEVRIEKKIKKPFNKEGDSLNVKQEKNVTIVINGDKVTINGKETDINDPRIKKIKRLPGRDMITITDTASEEDPLIIEDGMDFDFAPPPPPPPSINKAFLGVITEKVDAGAKVIEVSPESPAAKAGIKENDIIVGVNDIVVTDPKSLYEAIGKFKPEEKIKVKRISENKENTIEVTLAKNKNTPNIQSYRMGPDNNFKFTPMPDGNFRGFNFKVPNMPRMDGFERLSTRPKLGVSIEDLQDGKGVKITDVKKDSPAEKAGLKTGDIINKFDNNEVTEVNDIKRLNFTAGQTIKLEINRGKEKKTIEVKIPKKINSADL